LLSLAIVASAPCICSTVAKIVNVKGGMTVVPPIKRQILVAPEADVKLAGTNRTGTVVSIPAGTSASEAQPCDEPPME
jgi:hypothetical protein